MKTRTINKKKKLVIDLIELKLPQFATAVKASKKSGVKGLIIHQDAFAADYQEEEFCLLGNAVKYAGIHNIELIINGKNRETLK